LSSLCFVLWLLAASSYNRKEQPPKDTINKSKDRYCIVSFISFLYRFVFVVSFVSLSFVTAGCHNERQAKYNEKAAVNNTTQKIQ